MIFTEKRFQQRLFDELCKREREEYAARELEMVKDRIEQLESELIALRRKVEGGTPVCTCGQESRP